MLSTREVIDLPRAANPDANVSEDRVRVAVRRGKVKPPRTFAGRFAWTEEDARELAQALGLEIQLTQAIWPGGGRTVSGGPHDEDGEGDLGARDVGADREAPPPAHVGPAPFLADAHEAARLCGISRSTWCKLDASGGVPEPVRLGHRKLWSAAELRAWCAASCPPRVRWQQVRQRTG